MAKTCIKCNAILTDPGSFVCRDCEEKARNRQSQQFAKKRRSFENVMAQSLNDFEAEEGLTDTHSASLNSNGSYSGSDRIGSDSLVMPSGSAEGEPAWGRCTICFQQYYGVGSHCDACLRKLDRSTDEWEEQKQKAAARRDGILRTIILSIGGFLVALSVGLWIVRAAFRTASDSDIPTGTSATTVKYDDLLTAEHDAFAAAQMQGVDATTASGYAVQLHAAGMPRIASYEFVQYMAAAASASTQTLPATIPAAVGACKYARGNAAAATSIIDIITKYGVAAPKSNPWSIATKAATGQLWTDGLAQFGNNDGDLIAALADIAKAAPLKPKVVAPTD
jgi:hypothetical protein